MPACAESFLSRESKCYTLDSIYSRKPKHCTLLSVCVHLSAHGVLVAEHARLRNDTCRETSRRCGRSSRPSAKSSSTGSRQGRRPCASRLRPHRRPRRRLRSSQPVAARRRSQLRILGRSADARDRTRGPCCAPSSALCSKYRRSSAKVLSCPTEATGFCLASGANPQNRAYRQFLQSPL